MNDARKQNPLIKTISNGIMAEEELYIQYFFYFFVAISDAHTDDAHHVRGQDFKSNLTSVFLLLKLTSGK